MGARREGDKSKEFSLELGRRMREIRAQRELTVQEVADRVDTTPGLIWRYERGMTLPSAYMVERLAGALDVSLRQLVPKISPKGNGDEESACVAAEAN